MQFLIQFQFYHIPLEVLIKTFNLKTQASLYQGAQNIEWLPQLLSIDLVVVDTL